MNLLALSSEILDIADKHMNDSDLLSNVQKWVQEDRASFLIKTLVNLDSTLGDIADALRRFMHLVQKGIKLSDSTLKGVHVSLVRQIVSEQLDYISIANPYTLSEVNNISESVLISLAVYIEEVRLIDNMSINI